MNHSEERHLPRTWRFSVEPERLFNKNESFSKPIIFSFKKLEIYERHTIFASLIISVWCRIRPTQNLRLV